MSNVERILRVLEEELDSAVELTLYGRAALSLGFDHAPEHYAWGRDMDAVLWRGQTEELAASTNFWQAVKRANQRLSDQQLYISLFLEEHQVVLLTDWRERRVKIKGPWPKISLYRLGALDLLLTKLMRDDPLDRADARFIFQQGQFTREQLKMAIHSARVPDIPEVQEQFAVCSKKFLALM